MWIVDRKIWSPSAVAFDAIFAAHNQASIDIARVVKVFRVEASTRDERGLRNKTPRSRGSF